MPIHRTPAEIIAEGPKLLARLGRALDAVERGDEGAGDELGGMLRILIDTSDRGNRGMTRLATALKVKLPAVWVSGGPEIDTRGGLVISFGNLPAVPAHGDGQPHTGRYLPFEAWIAATSLVVPLSEKRKLSWGAFATLAGNTGGAHLGAAYSDLLVTSELFDAVGLSLQDYLLRQVGWQVERSLADILASSGRPLVPRTRKVDLWPRYPIWMIFRHQPGVGVEFSLSIGVTSDDGPPIEIMRFRWRDRTHRVLHNGISKSGTAPVSLIIDDPVTGATMTTDAASHPQGWRPDDWGTMGNRPKTG
jgi:hypothetical protein